MNLIKEKKPPDWFKKELADKLNIPVCGEYKKINTSINFGNIDHDKIYCEHYEFKNLNQVLDFKEIIFNDIDGEKKITMLKNCLKNINAEKINAEKINAEKINAEKKYEIKVKALNTKISKAEDALNKPTICKKYTLKLTNNQKTIINEWFLEATKLYNKCVNLYNEDEEYFNENYMKTKLKIFEMLYKDGKPCPYDILTDEVRIFYSNLKSCKTNLKNKNINNFTMTEKKYNRRSYSLFIPKSAVKKNSIYGSILGEIDGLNLKEQTRDCRIVYIKDKNLYQLLTSETINKKKIKNRKKIAALDPGENIFIAYYSEGKFGKIGKGIRKKILAEEGKIRKLQRILSRKKNKKGEKLRNKKKIIKKIRKIYEKIHNIVKELHNKTALYLCKEYERVLIPKFETQKMVGRKRDNKKFLNELEKKEGLEEKMKELKRITKKRRLNGRVKFVLNMLSHYTFKQHLINKGNEYGCEIVEVTEEFTSKTCTKCGHISDIYKDRTKECEKCKFKINRDINGARNILIKNINISRKTEASIYLCEIQKD